MLLEQDRDLEKIKIVDFGTSLVYDDQRKLDEKLGTAYYICLLYTSPSPRDLSTSRMPSSA